MSEPHTEVDYEPRLDEVVSDPLNCPIPTAMWRKVSMGCDLAGGITMENMGAILTYLSRPEFGLGLELGIVLSACKRDPKLCETQAFVDFATRHKDVTI